MPNTRLDRSQISASTVFFVAGLLLLLFLATSAFQYHTGVFHPPLVAYWFLVFAVFLPRPLLWIGLVPLMFVLHIGIVFLARYLEQHGMPAGPTFIAIMQTEAGEALDYLEHSIGMKDWLASALLAFTLCAILHLIKNRIRGATANVANWRPGLVFVYLVGLSALVYFVSGLHSNVTTASQSIASTLDAFRSELDEQTQLREKLGNLTWSGSALTARFDGTMILILGESTTRNHLQIYGYPRETTPHLAQRTDQLLVQTDSISPHSYTVQSLSEVLSSANVDDGKAFSQAPGENVLSAVRAAGFKTYWFSNQNKYGVWDNLVSLLAQTADVFHFTRKSFGKIYSFKSFDHELLPLMEKALADDAPRKLIVLHLYATHFDYCSYVPEDFRNFQDQGSLGQGFFGNGRDYSKSVNCYDDAVRYVDSIVEQVIARAERSKESVFVSYIADHGEDPAGGTAHEIPLHRGPHVEIPFIWYANDSAQQVFANEIDNFRDNAAQPFKSSDFFHTLLDLLLEPSPVVREDRSLFSERYTPYSRTTIVSDDGPERVRYDEFSLDDNKDYYEKARANLAALRRADPAAWQRVWAHRVDSIGKLLEAKQMFAGVELDIVYAPDKQQFFVFHPPAANTGLTLEEFLHAAKDRKDLHFWLDWKNAAEVEPDVALKRLNELEKRFGIRQRSILELPTGFPLNRASVVRQTNWQLAYYMPTQQITSCAQNKTPDCDELAQKILLRAKEFDVRYLSFDYRARKFVRDYAGVFNGYKFLTWDLSRNAALKDLSATPFDPDVDVTLVGYPSIFHY